MSQSFLCWSKMCNNNIGNITPQIQNLGNCYNNRAQDLCDSDKSLLCLMIVKDTVYKKYIDL